MKTRCLQKTMQLGTLGHLPLMRFIHLAHRVKHLNYNFYASLIKYILVAVLIELPFLLKSIKLTDLHQLYLGSVLRSFASEIANL